MTNNDYDLDIKNPSKARVEECRDPEEIVNSISEKEKRIFDLMQEIRTQLSKGLDNAK